MPFRQGDDGYGAPAVRGIVRTGLAARRLARTPVATGVAIDVPLMTPQRFPKIVETIATPGAVRATLSPRLVVENKRLTRALEVAKAIQEQRDDWRRSAASRTHRGEPANGNKAKRRPGTKTQRAFRAEDVRAAVEKSAWARNRSRRSRHASPLMR